MYNYGTTGSIFDSVSNIYLLSTATLLLAIIIAFYMSNLTGDTGMIKTNQKTWQEQLTQALEVNKSESELQGSTGPIRVSRASDIDDGIDDALADGLVGKLKTARLKELEAQLTRDQLEEERRIEREQLAAIFELLKKQETELNMKEIDEEELVAQLNLYR